MNNPEILDTPNTEGEFILIPTSVGRRFGTYLIDSLVVSLAVRLLNTFDGPTTYYNGYVIDYTRLIMIFIGFFAYYIIMESIWGKTIGKFVTRTKVVTESGEKPGVGKCILRTLCRFIPFEPISVLTGMGWHDSIPGTMVVND